MVAKKKLYQIVKKALPKLKGASLHFCGSTCNGTGLNDGDVDLCLAVPAHNRTIDSDILYPVEKQGTFYPALILRHIRDNIESIEGVSNVQTIDARVSIIKFEYEDDGLYLPCDINVNNIAGIYNTFMLRHYTRIDERFQILSRLLKVWGKKTRIVDASRGYLNSYTMVLMVLHFLQCGVSPPILPNLNALRPDFFDGKLSVNELKKIYDVDLNIQMEKNDTPIGDLLLGFFRYYAMFNYQYDGICLRLGCVLPKDTIKDVFFLEEVYDRLTVPKNLDFKKLDYIKCTFLDTFLNHHRSPDFKKLMDDERMFMQRNL